MLSIIEYLCLYSTKTPVSKYHIMTKVTAIKQQRQDRVSLLLNELEDNGFIKSTVDDISRNKLYSITEKGFDSYIKWVKEFLSFVRTINDEE
jgi:DNA-binding PadR family transcriptional regulator